ncbi:hypothetical protein HY045_00425 [Candidatus Woesebacteria bacterium]|nr:hypothetical protein [Candidatus Woesebacteria bacterium]
MRLFNKFFLKYRKIITIVFCIVVVVLLFKAYTVFRITNVICRTQYDSCSDDLLLKLSRVRGKTLFESKRAVKALLSNDFEVSKFSSKFNLPDTLQVNILVRKPVFVLEPKNGDKFYLVDKSGFVLRTSSSTSLPILQTDDESFEIGKKVGDDKLFALGILGGVYNMYQIKYAALVDNSIKVISQEGITLVFPTSGDKDLLLGSVRLILSRLNKISQDSRIDKVQSIDLRFKNPIIK